MYSRIITCKIDPSRIQEFRAALNGEFLPRIQSQPGFVDTPTVRTLPVENSSVHKVAAGKAA